MAGTYTGGKSAAQTNKRKYGEDFYRRIGSYGGQSGKVDGTIKGFALMDREKVREAGRRGGSISRRGPKLPDPKPSLKSKIRSFLNGV
jgi:general stress protein YciG